MNRDKSMMSGAAARCMMFAAFLFMFTQFTSYVTMKTALNEQRATITSLESKLRSIETENAKHQQSIGAKLEANRVDVTAALQQVARSTSSMEQKLNQASSAMAAVASRPEASAPAAAPGVPSSIPARPRVLPPPPSSITAFDEIPYHLLSNDTEKATGGYTAAGTGQYVATTIYKKIPSLPEEIAHMDFSEITRLTGWTKAMLVNQLKLLLQCNGMPSQKQSWINKFMREFIHKNHAAKADVDATIASQLMQRETCSKLSTDAPEREELLEYFEEFIKLYTNFGNRPIEFNPLGQRLTHSFATWFHVKRLQPKYIIESGVHKGHTTWLMRQAAPNAIMIMMDPISSLIKHWDRKPGTIYYTGPANWRKPHDLKDIDIRPWIDFKDVDWSFISDEDKAHRTILLIDDHQDEWDRVQEIQARGFKRAMFDDNWFVHQGDNFSIKQLCDASAGSLFPNQNKEKVLRMANFSMSNKWFPLSKHQEDRAKFMAMTKSYFEMPPVLWYPPLIMYTQFRTHMHKDDPSNQALVYLTAAMVQNPIIQTQEEFDKFGMHVLPLREFWYYMNHCLIELK